jgi:hypothetical protein
MVENKVLSRMMQQWKDRKLHSDELHSLRSLVLSGRLREYHVECMEGNRRIGWKTLKEGIIWETQVYMRGL